MKSPDEIKKAFECCMQMHGCKGCSYSGERCTVELSKDALAYIKQLEEDRKERDIIADAYQQLEANQPKWISVEEMLPEPFVSVLVHIPGEEPLPQIHEGFITPDGTWCSVLYVSKYDRVAHWMPLPEPPKEA